jgi:hypothetical protein
MQMLIADRFKEKSFDLTVKCGHDASSVGSSSSGSKSGLSLGGKVRNKLHAICKKKD